MSQYSGTNYYMAPNPLAIWAFVLGILAMILSPVIVGGVIALVALVLGIVASRRPTNKGLAIAGIVMASLAIAVALMAGMLAFNIYHAAAGFAAAGKPENLTLGQIVAFELALDDFESDIDRYPTTAEGLAALKTAPPDLAGKWKGPYIDEIPDDPWGHPYIYVSPGKTGPDTYDVTSKGPDGVLGTGDDVTQHSGNP